MKPHRRSGLEGFSFFDPGRVGNETYLVSIYPALQRGAKEAKDLLLKAMRDRKADVLFFDGLRSLRDLWQNDPERLRQILDNLVSNAVKYGNAKPIIRELTVEGSRTVVRITDHGRGIASEAIPQIFDRFHRVPGQGGRGHGLGLYIAAALARLYSGELTVESKVWATAPHSCSRSRGSPRSAFFPGPLTPRRLRTYFHGVGPHGPRD